MSNRFKGRISDGISRDALAEIAAGEEVGETWEAGAFPTGRLCQKRAKLAPPRVAVTRLINNRL